MLMSVSQAIYILCFYVPLFAILRLFWGGGNCVEGPWDESASAPIDNCIARHFHWKTPRDSISAASLNTGNHCRILARSLNDIACANSMAREFVHCSNSICSHVVITSIMRNCLEFYYQQIPTLFAQKYIFLVAFETASQLTLFYFYYDGMMG